MSSVREAFKQPSSTVCKSLIDVGGCLDATHSGHWASSNVWELGAADRSTQSFDLKHRAWANLGHGGHMQPIKLSNLAHRTLKMTLTVGQS